MEIIKFEYFGKEVLFENLRRIHLTKQPDKKIYRDAGIKLMENVNPEEIVIPQYYVLEKDLAEIDECREALLKFGVDMFRLQGFVRVFSRESEKGRLQVFDVLPPVVEVSKADGGILLLNDGMHRMYLAREKGSTINVIVVEGVSEEYPYYAHPNEGGWESVLRCEEVPDIKKNYRIKEYKKLFRDFNTGFLNVTASRTNKKPAKIKVGGQKVEA